MYATQPEPAHRTAFHGDGASLFGIYLVTFLLSFVTLGIYSFWGRAEARRYLHAHTEFAGERFAYHGTGGELFRGWLKVMGVLIVLYAQIPILYLLLGDIGAPVGTALLLIEVILLMPYALVGSWRYRMSRTSYRGIRFSFRGTVGELFGLYVKGSLLTIVTLGLYTPYFLNDLRAYLARGSWYGHVPFRYDGEGRLLFGPFLVMLLLFIPTLGCSRFWYHAHQHRHYWGYTTWSSGRFDSTVTGAEWFGQAFVNFLLVVFTLGIGYPWAQVREARFVAGRLTLRGAPDLAGVQQQAMAAGAAGDALTDALNADGFDAGLGL